MSLILDRRRLLAAALISASGAALVGPAVAQTVLQSLPLTNPSLKERVQRSGAPALGFAVIGPEGVRALEVAGVRRLGATDLATTADAWHLGGDTKALTAALYARLVEQGRASWGARISTLFRDVRFHPAWAEVRIEDLLSHRAGINDRPLLTPERLRAFRVDARPLVQQRRVFTAELLARAPQGQPDAFDYSEAGYLLAGAAIERIARTDFETAMRTQLFEPLKMAGAGFGPPTGPDAPWGHELGPGARLVAVDPATVADRPAILNPAGGVHLPLEAYGRFVRLFLSDGGGVLSPDSLRRLGEPRGGAREGYGLGWQTDGDRPWASGPVLSHEGTNGLWRSTVLIAPAKGLGVITCCNADAGGGAEAAQALSLALVSLYTGATTPVQKPKRRWLFF